MLPLFLHVLGYHGGVTGLTCRGDSGGPLVEFNSEEEYYVQVGIVTGGACQSESEPAVFARIEDNNNFEFITKQFWDHISPTIVNEPVPCKDFSIILYFGSIVTSIITPNSNLNIF